MNQLIQEVTEHINDILADDDPANGVHLANCSMNDVLYNVLVISKTIDKIDLSGDYSPDTGLLLERFFILNSITLSKSLSLEEPAINLRPAIYKNGSDQESVSLIIEPPKCASIIGTREVINLIVKCDNEIANGFGLSTEEAIAFYAAKCDYLYEMAVAVDFCYTASPPAKKLARSLENFVNNRTRHDIEVMKELRRDILIANPKIDSLAAISAFPIPTTNPQDQQQAESNDDKSDRDLIIGFTVGIAFWLMLIIYGAIYRAY